MVLFKIQQCLRVCGAEAVDALVFVPEMCIRDSIALVVSGGHAHLDVVDIRSDRQRDIGIGVELVRARPRAVFEKHIDEVVQEVGNHADPDVPEAEGEVGGAQTQAERGGKLVEIPVCHGEDEGRQQDGARIARLAESVQACLLYTSRCV